MQVIDIFSKTKLLTANYDISIILVEVINGTYINTSGNNFLHYKRLIKPLYCNLVYYYGSPFLGEVLTLQYEKNFIACNRYGDNIRGIQINPQLNTIRVSFEEANNTNLSNYTLILGG